MTEIAALFALGLSDSMIASRLGVGRASVHRWRRGRVQPCAAARLKARTYLRELHGVIHDVSSCLTPL